MKTPQTMTSPSKPKSPATPKIIARPQIWVRCESLKDFWDEERGKRIQRMPYWIYDEETEALVFDFVDSTLTKEELLRMIRKGWVYILKRHVRSKETRGNLG